MTSKPQPASAKQVPCPTCGGPSLFSPANPYRPFCSQRCQQIDLGAWAAEDFRMPAEAPPEDAEFGDPCASLEFESNMLLALI